LRILADENVHLEVVRRLRTSGYDVEWVAETAPGSSDPDILRRNDIRELVLITYDRDFGDLIFNQEMPQPNAIIFSRLGRVEPRFVSERIADLLAEGLAPNHIHVLTKDGIRSAPFPAGV
jgi:predicted nuclease of predicted toxin-antitoxin system